MDDALAASRRVAARQEIDESVVVARLMREEMEGLLRVNGSSATSTQSSASLNRDYTLGQRRAAPDVDFSATDADEGNGECCAAKGQTDAGALLDASTSPGTRLALAARTRSDWQLRTDLSVQMQRCAEIETRLAVLRVQDSAQSEVREHEAAAERLLEAMREKEAMLLARVEQLEEEVAAGRDHVGAQQLLLAQQQEELELQLERHASREEWWQQKQAQWEEEEQTDTPRAVSDARAKALELRAALHAPTRKVIYLASPYSHTDPDVVKQRVRDFAITAARLESEGDVHVVSAMFNHMLLEHATLPSDWEFWKSYSLTILDRADAVYVLQLDGWEKSSGVAGEIEHARNTGKPVVFLDGTKTGLPEAKAQQRDDQKLRPERSEAGVDVDAVAGERRQSTRRLNEVETNLAETESALAELREENAKLQEQLLQRNEHQKDAVGSVVEGQGREKPRGGALACVPVCLSA